MVVNRLGVSSGRPQYRNRRERGKGRNVGAKSNRYARPGHVMATQALVPILGSELFLTGWVPHRFLAAPRTSVMASTSQSQEGSDDILPTLDGDIQVLNHAKDSCVIQPAQDAFDSASALLTRIKVLSSLPRNDLFQAHVSTGLHGQQPGLRRSCAVLYRCM